MNKTNGIHHITAITADPQKNLDFYEGFLGQKLVKKTVNFDDPNAYHLYYGDAIGTPGTIMTFFYWKGIRQGVRGSGEVASVYYIIKSTSLDYWKKRADDFDISYSQKTLVFGEIVLMISDPDGLEIGLVVSDIDTNIIPWLEGSVPKEHVLNGFYGALLALPKEISLESTLKDGLGFEIVETKEGITRYQATHWPGKFITTIERSGLSQALQGAGSIHHIAFQANTDDDLAKIKTQVNKIGIGSTGLIDRQYFHSTYFMTPAGILFEIATNDIGFTIDEEKAELGEHLKLPPQYESRREDIDASLVKIILPRDK